MINVEKKNLKYFKSIMKKYFIDRNYPVLGIKFKPSGSGYAMILKMDKNWIEKKAVGSLVQKLCVMKSILIFSRMRTYTEYT